ncbi:hypothetical protein O3P69_012804 [Scylla paramamosain]|uniref:Uncharacterized protein n=1 Tax=Scylla paramamosain TaxID=85552 RepID=A0AAW0TQT8_SCYPA
MGSKRGAGRKQEPHTHYNMSLEHLPLVPLRKKPPLYASKGQQDTRRGIYPRGVLSGSTEDLTQAGNKTRVVNKSPGKDARGRTKDRGDSSLPLGCGEKCGASGDVSGAPRCPLTVLMSGECAVWLRGKKMQSLEYQLGGESSSLVVAVSRREVLSQQGALLLFYLQCQQEEGQGATHRTGDRD